MYFKLNDKIMFRNYGEYGLLIDNSMFGYKFLNEKASNIEELYISDIGAAMVDSLKKIPQDLDIIIGKLMNVFVEVDYEELKQDTYEFFMQLVKDGFLSYGDTYELCIQYEKKNNKKIDDLESDYEEILIEDCSSKIINENDFLRSIHIEIVSECNERCIHCYIPHYDKWQIMDSDLFYRIVEEGREMNAINITISGGEPLLHKDFIRFLKKCRELDLSVNVLSNLTLLNDEIINEIKKNPLLSVQTSLYSMNPVIHDSITKVKGSFEKTKASILKLIKNAIPVQISCPIMKQNKDTYRDVIMWGKSYNIAVFTDNVIFASYDHTNKNLENRLSEKEVEEVFDAQLTKEYAIALQELAMEKCKLTEDAPICSVCRYYICVSAKGEVFPCVGWQSYIVGNLNTVSLREIWENSPKVRQLRQIKRSAFSKCVTCEDRGYCTICMMSNCNENHDGDFYKVNDFHCKVASMTHKKVENILK